MRRTVAVVLFVLSLTVLAGCSAPASTPSAGGASGATPASIVSERCTRCHPVDRIKAAQHDAAAWTATVTRMRGKGAQLSDAEAQQVIDFLAGGGAAGL
jgi:cytochrome c5